jgi:hypothetical protein
MDGSPPDITTFTISTTTSNSLTEHITVNSFSATDNVSVTGYQITDSPNAPAGADSGWEGTATTTYSLFCPAQNTSVFVCNATLYAWAKDAAGNVSTGTPQTVNITVTNPAPIITSFTADSVANKQGLVNITAFAASGNNGVNGYLLNETGVKSPCIKHVIVILYLAFLYSAFL